MDCGSCDNLGAKSGAQNLFSADGQIFHFDRSLNGKYRKNGGVEVVECRMLWVTGSKEDTGRWFGAESDLIVKIKEGG